MVQKTGQVLIETGVTHTDTDPCLYFKKMGDYVVHIGVYVNDLLVAGNGLILINDIKKRLNEKFKTRDFGEVSSC